MIRELSSKQIIFRMNLFRISKMALLGFMVVVFVLNLGLFLLGSISAGIIYVAINDKIKNYEIEYRKQKNFEENMRCRERLEQELEKYGCNRDIERSIEQTIIKYGDQMLSGKTDDIPTMNQIIKEAVQSTNDSKTEVQKHKQYSEINNSVNNLSQTKDLGKSLKLQLTKNKEYTKYKK